MKSQSKAGISFLLLLTLAACGTSKGGTTGGNPVVSEDSSVSGEAAAAVGGALSGSSSGGLQASFRPLPMSRPMATNNFSLIPKAWATNLCPTFRTTTAGECTASSGTMWLDYSDCSFGSSAASWSGTQTLIMSAGSATCGAFPNPGAGNSLYRQFVTTVSSTTPASIVMTSPYGTRHVINDRISNLANFNGDTISTLIHGGYGTKVDFDGTGARSGLTIAHWVYVTGRFDHSVAGNLTITETAGASSRQLSGSVSIYHNGLRVIGTATFNGVTHSDQCCLPISGSITTAFAAGSNVAPTAAGALFVGKSETLTFTGCGTATLVDTSGASTDVALSRCY